MSLTNVKTFLSSRVFSYLFVNDFVNVVFWLKNLFQLPHNVSLSSGIISSQD